MKLLLIIFTKLAFALKPAPFTEKDNIKFESLEGYLLVSERFNPPVPRRDNYSIGGYTNLYKKDGKKLLWSMQEFLGRAEFELSPDGRFLAKYGGPYFGSRLSIGQHSSIVVIYEMGKKIKTVKIGDLFKDLKKTLREREISYLGGGWVARSKVIISSDIDWKKRTIDLKTITGSKTIPF